MRFGLYACFLAINDVVFVLLLLLYLLLLWCRIDTRTRSMAYRTRSEVFGQLAKVLSCEKETLIKRVKRMVLAQHDEKLRRPIASLKEGTVKNF